MRTHNNPVSDYAEWLVVQKLGLSLESSSHAGYDAISSKGEKFQIKSRRSKKSRQLSVIRNLEAKKFDYLIAVLFEDDFAVREAYKIPHRIIKKYAQFSPHQNGYILQLRCDILKDASVEDITSVFSRAIS